MLDDIELDPLGIEDDQSDASSWTDSLGGISRTLFSALIFFGSLILLYWNEGSSKQHGDAIAEAGRLATAVAATAPLDPALDGRPVHLAATVTSAGGVRDPYFAISSDGVGLYRDVYMYQWIEYKETRGRGSKRKTTYSYGMDWDDQWHDSSKFEQPVGHENPPMPIQSEGFFAEDARFGPYRFDNTDVFKQALAEYDGDGGGPPGSLGSWPRFLPQLPALNPQLIAQRWYQIEADEYYRGNEQVEHYELGDLSVNFYAFPSNYPLTVLAAQQGDRLVKWQASNGDTVLLAAGGNMPADQLVAEALALNSSRTHLLRIVGLIGSCLGFAGLMSALGGVLVSLPVVGRLIELSLVVAGMLIGLVFGGLSIGLGWLLARPWVGLLLLVALVVLFGWGGWRQRLIARTRKEAARIAQAAANARQRAAERAAMPPLSGMAGMQPALAAAGGAGTTPPLPGQGQERSAPPPLPPAAIGLASAGAAGGAGATPTQAAAETADSLPALDWTPSALANRPPAVMPRDPQARRPFDAVDEDPATEPDLPALDWPGANPIMAEPATVPSPQPADPPMRAPSQSQQPTTPLWETVEPRNSPTQVAPEPSVATEAAAPPPAAPIARSSAADPTAAASKNLRVRLGRKGPYTLNKLIRRQPDGSDHLICYELMRDGKPIKRGNQAQVREELQKLLRTSANTTSPAGGD